MPKMPDSPMNSRFFSPDSFWNTALPPDAAVDPRSPTWIDLLAREPRPNFWINQDRYTIPVYPVDDSTPRRRVHPIIRPEWNHHRSGHGRSFDNLVPWPEGALPDPGSDRHIAMIDYGRRQVWDMFYVKRRADGEWESLTGMSYSLDSDGVFDPAEMPDLRDGDSVHQHGPGRAAGVPIIAGLILREEVAAGAIEHKLAFATAVNAEKEYVWPATWTDGFIDGGLPEGCVLQLDPALDLDRLGLSAGGKIVARALQRYGAVNVDVAGGTVLYAEGLYARAGLSWQGLLDPSDLRGLDIRHFRVLTLPPLQRGGKFRPEAERRTLHARLWGQEILY